MLEMKRVLVVSPHADDELFGAGGTLLKLKVQGARIKLVLVASGDVQFRSMDKFIPLEVRQAEFRHCAEELSTEPPFIFDWKERTVESRLDIVPLHSIVTVLDGVIADFKPDTLLMPEPSHHQDHQAVNKACFAALRPSSVYRVPTVLMYEEPGAAWGAAEFFKPNFFVDVTGFFDRKLELFEEVYPSQFTNGSRTCYAPETLRQYATFRGAENGMKYAEAFELVRCTV